MDKIHYLPTEGTTGFWGLRGCPEEPEFKQDHPLHSPSLWFAYHEALESCKSNKLEIVNPETIAICLFKLGWQEIGSNRMFQSGDIFDLPIGYEFKEQTLYSDGQDIPEVWSPVDDEDCIMSKKVLRLVKTETKEVMNAKEFNLPPACVFNLQQIALADDDMVKHPKAGERYRFIAQHILELFQKDSPQPEPEESQNEKEWERFWYRFGENDFDMRNAHKYYTIQRKKQ